MKQRTEKANTIRFCTKHTAWGKVITSVTYTEKGLGSFDKEMQQKHKAGSAVSANGMRLYKNLTKPIWADFQVNKI